MLTRCPTCQTTFRVTAEQLMARQGRVRCGQCLGVFNALGSLIEESPSAVAPPAETIVIDGFDVPPIAAPTEVPPPGVGEPPPETEPIEPTVATMPLVEPDGEDVAQPAVEYVNIGELPLAPLGAAVSGDEPFEDEFASTEINIEAVREPEIVDQAAAEPGTPPEQSPDDQFTKTVVGFTWYVEPETAPGPADQPVADEFARTVIAPWRATAPEVKPESGDRSGGREHADLAFESITLVEPAPASTIADAPADADFTKTVIESVKFTEPEAVPHQHPLDDEFARTVVAPWRATAPEVKPESGDRSGGGEHADLAFESITLVAPEAASTIADAPADADFTKTVIESVKFTEPEAVPDQHPLDDEFARTVVAPWRATAPEATPETVDQPHVGKQSDLSFESITFVEPASASTTAKGSTDDDFAKTVIESVKLAEPEEAPIEPPFDDEFARTMVQPRQVAPAVTAERPSLNVVPRAPIEPAVPAAVAPPPSVDAAGRNLDRAVFDSSRIIEPATEDELDDLEFDLAPIDDIHVEEVEEPPSILDMSVEPAISFPKLEPLPEPDEAAYAPANTILQELAATTGSVVKRTRPTAIEHHEMPEPDSEDTPGPPTQPGQPSRTAAVAEPPSNQEAEPDAEPASQMDSILELQELPQRRRWPWVLGGLVAACLLAAQAIVYYRVELSVLMPRTKPALMAMCGVLDCKVALPSQIDLIGIETSDLSPGPEGAGHLQLAATLRNRAPFVQTWPDLELTLTDGTDKALVRRVVAPAEYLPPARKASDGFPPRSEQTVYLDLKAPGVPAVGYRLYVFYP